MLRRRGIFGPPYRLRSSRVLRLDMGRDGNEQAVWIRWRDHRRHTTQDGGGRLRHGGLGLALLRQLRDGLRGGRVAAENLRGGAIAREREDVGGSPTQA